MFSLRRSAAALVLFSAVLFQMPVGALEPDWDFVSHRLRRAGFKSAFIAALRKSYEPEDFAKVLELNTLLFLRKADYHGPQVSDDAARQVKTFVEAHRDDFDATEKKDHVSPTVVAALMWMESRYGVNTGQFHVGSAFIDLIQADRPQNISYLRERAVPKFTDKLGHGDRRKIAKQARKRARWAMGELKSLNRIWVRDHKLVEGLRGSFAGAFGIPQFEPTSYVRYARAQGDGAPDLSQPADAIRSVAHYLRQSGWRADRLASHRRALLKYNHSEDYARAILDLAARAETQLRAPSGKPSVHLRTKHDH